MQRSKKLYWTAQIIGWLVYAMLTFLATYADDPKNITSSFWISVTLLIISGFLVTHWMRWFLLSRNWLELKFGQLFPRLLLISVITATVLAVFSNFSTAYVFSKIDPDGDKEVTFLKVILDVFGAIVLMILWNAIYFTYHFFRKSINQELYNLQLQSSQNEIELKNLRTQLNPHFLFNSLNSIRALIDIEPSKAKKSVTTLSNLLRSSLVLGKNEFITMNEELEIVKSYLDLEKIRFEERLEIVWELDDSLSEYLIPPFIIQTQTENAIKHGISRIVAGGKIIIRTEMVDDTMVRISVINTGKLAGKIDSGIGIENTKRRLDLQYKGSARFLLFEEAGFVVSSIEISK